MSISIILADDHQMVREGLYNLLSSEHDFEVIGQAVDGNSAIRLTRKLLPDIIIMDINMPGINGIEASKVILSERPEMKVIALSMHSYRRFIIEMFKAGASGYLLKNCAFSELANAIRVVYSNHKYISPTLMGDAFIENYVQDFLLTAPPAFSLFSEQEKHIFSSFKSGKTLEHISDELNMDFEKVHQCLNKLLKQLNLEYLEDFTKTMHEAIKP